MGGDSSKHLSASSTARSHERKRSGLSSALAGGDCRSTSDNARTHLAGPSYGNIPAHIPGTPVKCAAVPIAPPAALDKALTWIPDTEALLVTEWNRERQETAAAGLRGGGGKGKSNDAATTNTSSAAGTPPPAGANSGEPIGRPGRTPSPAMSATNLVPLSCDCTPATTGRSTGLTFRVPTTWTQSAAAGSVGSSSSPSSPKLPSDKRPGSSKKAPSSPAPSTDAGTGAGSSLVISALPVGIEYYRALQARWVTPESRALPPATEEEDLNDSVILEAVSDPDGSVLSPPVPLGYMIDLFVPQWRAEGLFDQAELARVPETPVGCTPSPINLGAARDLTISWLSQAESVLVLDWAKELEIKKAARAAKAEEAAARRRELRAAQEQQAGSEITPAAQLVAEAGLHPPRLSSSSSASSVDSWSSSATAEEDEMRRAEGLVPVDCDHAPFPFNRSCGVVFEQPSANATGNSRGVSGGAAAANDATATLPTRELPVGMDYYSALQKAWSRRPDNLPKLPPLASEADVNISDIDDVLSGDSDYEELNPPVPLGLMISYFAEDWRENGLYDVVQKREEQLSSQAQRK